MPVTITQPIERTVIDDRHRRTGHPFNALPAAILDAISSFSGYQYYVTDFIGYNGPAVGTASPAGDWTLDDVGTAAVVAEDSAQFGALQIATSAVEDDNAILQLRGEAFRYVDGKRIWCFARLNVSDANDGEAIFGLAIRTADFVAALPTDGIFFEKGEVPTEFDFHVRKNGASTESELVTGTFTDGGYRIIGFLVDTDGSVKAYDGTTLADLAVVATVGTSVANLPDDEDLTLIIGIETGAALAKDITVDWVFLCQER